jgi:hypothetical protein
VGEERATAAWWKAEADGWKRENDRHRAHYVEAVKERDRLRAVVDAAKDLLAVIDNAQPDGDVWRLSGSRWVSALRGALDVSPNTGGES